MASSRGPPRRPQALQTTSVLSTPKPTISMDAWESNIPLQEKQLKSIESWKAYSEKKQPPVKFDEEINAPNSRPETPLKGLKQREGSLRPSSRPATPVGNLPLNPRGRHPLHPANPIHTPQQFHDWFALIERSIQHSQEAHFRSHLSQLTQHIERCDGLSKELDRVDNQTMDMLAAWQSVEEGGRSLQGASEQLLEEKNRLSQVTEAIYARLAYFQELERATRLLNHPGDDLVLQPDFLITVERIDICLEYLQHHKNYLEADIYILRFQQCLTRAMTLIKIFFAASLRSLTLEIERQLGEKSMSSTSAIHLLYSRFVTFATKTSPLLAELETRALSHPVELNSLLEECQTGYLATRKSLLAPRVLNEIKGLDPANSDLIDLTRTGCGYLRQLCEDEFTLYRRFFNTGESKLYRYLESLCDFLYDDLRPRILHEPKIAVLCEVCTVLQALMVIGTDISISETASEDDDGAESIVPPTPMSATKQVQEESGLEKLQISVLLQMILQDAQTRLVFKAQAILQSDIRLYLPTDDDLRYPDKLIEYRSSNPTPVIDLSLSSEDDLLEGSSETQQAWYPSVGRTVWVLSLIKPFVKPAIFRDIAQEAVGFCRESVEVASQRIGIKNDPYASMDSKLFLIYHLLVLKQLVKDVNLDAPTSVADSPKAKTAAAEPSSEGFLGIALFKPAAFLGNLASLGVPRILSGIETRWNIDQELKDVCEKLIYDCVVAATLPIRTFVERSSAYLETFGKSPTTEKNSLLTQDFATPKQALETNEEFKQVCEQEVKRWAARLRLFLDDEKTVSALCSPLEHQILEEYSLFRGLLAGRYGAELLQEADTESRLLSKLREWCTHTA